MSQDNAKRLNKFISETGFCSRREAFMMILPLPTALVDVLIGTNMSIAVVLLMLVQQSLSALRETICLLRQLRQELGIPKEKIILLINRYDKKKDLSLKKIEQTTEITHIITLPNDFVMAENCTDLGKLVVEIEKNHKLVNVFDYIVSEITPHETASPKRPGLLGRLLGRH